MNVSFAITDVAVSEGEGVVTLILEKTEGAIGPVSVRIFTTAGTALGMGQKYQPNLSNNRYPPPELMIDVVIC